MEIGGKGRGYEIIHSTGVLFGRSGSENPALIQPNQYLMSVSPITSKCASVHINYIMYFRQMHNQ
eukprot:5663253-Karenia_brevis.AAC.1